MTETNYSMIFEVNNNNKEITELSEKMFGNVTSVKVSGNKPLNELEQYCFDHEVFPKLKSVKVDNCNVFLKTNVPKTCKVDVNKSLVSIGVNQKEKFTFDKLGTKDEPLNINLSGLSDKSTFYCKDSFLTLNVWPIMETCFDNVFVEKCLDNRND